MKVAVIDINYGDSGKSKIENTILTRNLYLPAGERYTSLVRHGGGCNSGQDWEHEGTHIVSHLFPPGADPEVYKMVLAGVAVNPDKAMKEIREREAAGIMVTPESYGISGRAQVTLLHHIWYERDQEKGKKSYGTTKSGIAPTFMDAVGKRGITFAEFVGPNFGAWLEDWKDYVESSGGAKVDVGDWMDEYAEAREFLGKLLVNEGVFWDTYGDENMLICGHQGMGLCPWYGNIPFTSSAHQRLPDNAYRVGIAKAIPSSVGKRNFMEAMPEELQAKLRGSPEEVDGEFGKTTKRPRQLGYPAAMLWGHHSATSRINGLALTKLDWVRNYANITGEEQIPVCVGYKYNGVVLSALPDDRYVHDKCEPHFRMFPISGEDISGVRNFDDLPSRMQDFVDDLTDTTGFDWDMLSVGPETDQIIINENSMTRPGTELPCEW